MSEQIPVNIHIESRIDRGKSEPTEKIDFHRQGQLYFKNSYYYLRYPDPMEGVGDTIMTIKFRQGEALILRQGALSMRQPLVNGETTEGIYHHPLGKMNLKTQTQAIHFHFVDSAATGRLRLDYGMELNGETVGQYTLIFQIKEVPS